ILVSMNHGPISQRNVLAILQPAIVRTRWNTISSEPLHIQPARPVLLFHPVAQAGDAVLQRTAINAELPIFIDGLIRGSSCLVLSLNNQLIPEMGAAELERQLNIRLQARRPEQPQRRLHALIGAARQHTRQTE